MPSFILIHPTVWPQYTNVADRQTDRQTDRTGQDRTGQDRTGQYIQWSNRIWRTVLQPVAQKRLNRSRCHLGEDSGEPKKPYIRWVSDPPWEGTILRGKGRPVV